MKPIVFVGPSLYGHHTATSADIDLEPPAGSGDILKAVQAGRRVIGLIDGTFESGPAVWHKEILYALSLGCAVFGAASMGALRAAECYAFGIVGVGTIFEDYRSGRRTSDGDVALTFGPPELGYPPTSLPLVDAEDALAGLLAAAVLDEEGCDRLRLAARTMFFKDRSWDQLFEVAGVSTANADRCRCWLAASGPGRKTRDALELLQAVRRATAPRAAYPFEPTLFFDQLRQSFAGG